MKIEVISEQIIHNGTIYKVGEVIDGIGEADADRLCNQGRCEIIAEKPKKEPTKVVKKK